MATYNLRQKHWTLRLHFPPYALPSAVLKVGENIERKVNITVATVKEGKQRRSFF